MFLLKKSAKWQSYQPTNNNNIYINKYYVVGVFFQLTLTIFRPELNMLFFFQANKEGFKMKVKDLRAAALKKANDLEAKAAEENKNCLLMPAFQRAMQVVDECDKVLRDRTDKAAEDRAEELKKFLEG